MGRLERKAGTRVGKIKPKLLLQKKMRTLCCLLMLISLQMSGQKLSLNLRGSTDFESKKIDSMGYVRKHVNAKSVNDEANLFLERVLKMGFLESKKGNEKRLNDSVFEYLFDLGRQTKWIRIKVNEKKLSLKLSKPEHDLVFVDFKGDSLKLAFGASENFLKGLVSKFESIGFSMATVRLTNLKKKLNEMHADLEINVDRKRQLNDIVINGYDKFPAGHLKNLKRLYKNKLFTQANLAQLNNDVAQFRFIETVKYPEILFTKDSTKIFVYVDKAKNNTFDGFLGFTNDDKRKVVLSGYVDLVLNNVLNYGEKFNLNWRSNGKEQRNFNAGIELPYVFKSPVSVRANLNIIKQDSTFQTTQTSLDLGYYFNYNTRLFLGYQSSESSDIKNKNTTLISDFTNDFVTSNFEYVSYNKDNFLFPEKTVVSFKIGAGKRVSKFQDNAQYFGSMTLKHDFYLNEKNIINLKSQNYYLQSTTYIINELYRFGGINSIRGFVENSLQGSLFASVLTEYRFVVAPNLYVHSILDYGYYQDKSATASNRLLGIGFGFGLLTKNGLFNLVYSNGSTQNQELKFSNSVVQISLKATF